MDFYYFEYLFLFFVIIYIFFLIFKLNKVLLFYFVYLIGFEIPLWDFGLNEQFVNYSLIIRSYTHLYIDNIFIVFFINFI